MTTLVKNNQTNTIKASCSSSTGGGDSGAILRQTREAARQLPIR